MKNGGKTAKRVSAARVGSKSGGKTRYEKLDLEKAELSLLTSSVGKATQFFGDLMKRLHQPGGRIKVPSAELQLMSVVLVEFAQSGSQHKASEALAQKLVVGGGGQGDGKDIGTVSH